MSEDRKTIEDVRDLQEPERSGQSTPENPILIAHRLLRGRYKFLIPLAILVSAPAAWYAYGLIEPKYASSGMVRVRVVLPRLMHRMEEAETPPMFDSFVSEQAQFLQSRRVIDRAVRSQELREVGWPSGPSGVSRLERSLRVSHRARQTLIMVQVEDTDPVMARAAVNAVLDAYYEIYGASSAINVTERERQLSNLRREHESELSTVRERIFQITEPYGTDNLSPIHEQQVTAVQDLRTRLEEIQIRLAEAGESGEEANGDTGTPDLRELAQFDPELEQLLREEAALKSDRRRLAQTHGTNHRRIRTLSRQIEETQRDIDRRVDVLIESGIAELAGADAVGISSRDRLLGLQTQYQRAHDSAREELQRLNEARRRLVRERDREQTLERRLADVSRELENLRVERENLATGRVSIEQRGEMPHSTSSDRRLHLAVLAAGASGGSVVGMFLLLGLLGRRCRYMDDLEHGHLSVPLLSALPRLDKNKTDDDEAVALSVHHMRNLLQFESNGTSNGHVSGRVYTITSPSPGDGKTSIAMALGTSFAMAGFNTLLVDADLVGRGMTRHVNANESTGLSQLLEFGELGEDSLVSLSPCLTVLPAGSGSNLNPENISRKRVGEAIQSLRSRFDVVIIDTGPLMGSLEANLVVTESDRAVLAVARGADVKLVRAALERLRSLGVACAGVVFNKAYKTDLERSTSSLTVSRQSIRSRSDQRDFEDSQERDHVVRAILRLGDEYDVPHRQAS